MTFKEASETELPFGKHRGETIDGIARSDGGLLYLDWLNGWMAEVEHRDLELRKAVAVYLGDDDIRRELERLLEDG